MMRWHWVVAVVVAAMLAGCGTDANAPVDPALPRGESLGELRQQAREALARYDQAVIDAGGAGAVTPTPPPWNSPPGIAIESAATTGAGTQLTVDFTGTFGPATGPCGADYHAESVESANAVVVIVIAQHHNSGEVCTLAGYSRTATLNLAQPLGRRPVLEVRQGQPVPLTRR
ncbi:hypothetical protein LUPAC06_00659 [Micromonospora saelicesensis]|uniref:hypothetical protein n=1 Tax=Micromonospora saelicesensis TaxID=285676 RepID=UPI000DBFACF3|nr:hypothetical protein [Micromonospora saelicesensis]RAO62296.1 hypothetical protein LUPAC06_00659 [Micromonospora saelicesensis]